MKTKIALVLMIGLGSAIFWHKYAHAGEKVVVGKHAAEGQRVSMNQCDHGAWDFLLQKYVDDRGRVNYRMWKASQADLQRLDAYLEQLSAVNLQSSASLDAQFAYWINAYNAVTIKGILREFPTSSIRNHTAKLIGYNIWNDLLLIVGDKKVSLNQMEHEVLRKMGDPRIHFAIVCASHSCPRLLNRAYVAGKIDQQLVENTKNFFANPDNFQYDVRKDQFKLSSILDWFKEDFGTSKNERLNEIAPYLPTDAAQTAANQGAVSVSYLKYDWSLNEQRKP